MAENTPLIRPSAGQSSTVSVGPNARLEFSFDQGNANLSKAGQNLVFTFDDGAILTLEGFYDNFGGKAQPPTLVVQDNELPGETFLAALHNPDLMPAAGLAGPQQGGGLYEDADLSSVDGVDGLDKLGFAGWTHIAAGGPKYQGAGVTGGGLDALGRSDFDSRIQKTMAGRDGQNTDVGAAGTDAGAGGGGGGGAGGGASGGASGGGGADTKTSDALSALHSVNNVAVLTESESKHVAVPLQGDSFTSNAANHHSGGLAASTLKECGFDLLAAAKKNGISWDAALDKSNNGAGKFMDVEVRADGGTVAFSGNLTANGNVSAAYYFVLLQNIGGKWVPVQEESGKAAPGDGPATEFSIEWNGLDEGSYKFLAFVLPTDKGNNLATLTLLNGGANWLEPPAYEYEVAGNVIGDPTFAAAGVTGADGGDKDYFVNANGEPEALKAENAYVASWTFTDHKGDSVTIDTSTGNDTYNGGNYAITFCRDGSYEFRWTNDGNPDGQDWLNNLDITYTLMYAKDGVGYEDTAVLYIRDSDHVSPDGLVYNSDFSIIHGSENDDTFSLTSGNHTIYGGGGHDTFAYTFASLSGEDHIKDWQAGDKLDIDAVLTSGSGTLNELLSVQWDDTTEAFTGESGDVSIALSIDAGCQATLTVTEGANSKTIVMEGYDFASQVALHDDAAAQILLHDMIKVAG